MASEQSLEDLQQDLQVTFFPSLYLQRRIWIFDFMRRENITDVLDVGCGDGEMLCALCNTAPWLVSPSDTSDKYKYLHPRYLRGLDISATDLEYAVKFTSPPCPQKYQHSHSGIRWEPLRVDIWKGGLETINPQFIGVECIVSSEVIEHLAEDVLSKFAQIILGVYHPRFLLVTTPSYTFNARFSPPPNPTFTSNIRPGGFLDPTGRTNRVFRHPDHKFEWTVREFTDWCNEVAKQWGYHVEVKGVGKSIEKDAWGRDDQCGWASQVALFTQIQDEATGRTHEEKVSKMLRNGESHCDHELLVTHYHNPHPSAGNPRSPKEILEKVEAEMNRSQCSRLTIEELWREDEIAIACGGRVDDLVNSVENGPTREFVLHKNQETSWREDWQIELVGGIKQKENLWAEDDETIWQGDRQIEY